MKNDILNFIQPFQKKEVIRTFKYENSFWFAYILQGRFGHAYNAKVVYDDTDPDDLVFGCRIGDNVYDITGIITNESPEWKPWGSLWEPYEGEKNLNEY